MNDRSERERNQEPEVEIDPTNTDSEIPQGAGIAAGMFFPVFIILAVAAAVIIYFIVR